MISKEIFHYRILEKPGEGRMGKDTRFDKMLEKARAEAQKLKKDMTRR